MQGHWQGKPHVLSKTVLWAHLQSVANKEKLFCLSFQELQVLLPFPKLVTKADSSATPSAYKQ